MKTGVDIGGTFTDVLVAVDGGDTLRVIKTPSTPSAPEEGVVDGLAEIDGWDGRSVTDVDFFSHGTTVATNAVLEGEWAETALVTTEGFRDVLEIGRQNRPDLYDFRAEKPTPIVPRNRRYEVPERITGGGETLVAFDEEAARDVARRIAASDATAVAVCFLNSFADATHERRMRDLLREECPEVTVTLSSDVLPEIREYERTTTTAMSSGLEPVMDRYLGNLSGALSEMGVPASLNVMQSNGGIITAETARRKAVNTLLSGPAAGVRGAAHVGAAAGYDDLLTLDMGGTSCDVSIVLDGEPVRSAELDVGEYPVRIPMIDVHTIGSGGGSLAWIDGGGALRVGPKSAGAEPGPICYGRGGERVTITDAHALLGRVDPNAFLGGDLGVPEGTLREAFEEQLCDALGRSPTAAAQDVLDVANANMQRALGVMSTERGHDLREFTLVAFGGAGPLHATSLARDLDIGRVLVPRHAGVLSALGLLVSDTVYDFVRSHLTRWDEMDADAVEAAFEDMETRGDEQLADADVEPDARSFERAVDLRYVGQSFELTVPVPGSVTDDAAAEIAARFHDRHRQRYGHADLDEPLELVNLRVDAVGRADPPSIAAEAVEGTVEAAVRTTRPVHFDGEAWDCPVYDRTRLPTDGSFAGPAVVEGPESTVAVHPDQRADVDEYGNLVVTTEDGA